MSNDAGHPIVFVVGGPNGAGKSTSAATVLGEEAQAAEFLNADTIARGLSAFEPERSAFQAGRIMIGRVKELLANRSTFAFESTLSSRTFAPMLAEARANGYRVNLLYLWLNSPELSLKRVAARVASGGHNIPEEDVRRRYGRGVWNFLHLYKPLADRWVVYNNSGRTPTLVATGHLDTVQRIANHSAWKRMQEIADGQSKDQEG